jgi:hypothetical protein
MGGACPSRSSATRWPGPVTVDIVEASPARVRVANVDLGYLEADHGHICVLDVPVNRRLRPERS